MEIIKLIFGIFLTLSSLILFFIAFKFFYKYLIQEKMCTAKTTGTVVKYTNTVRGGENSGVFLPVVQYNVNGKEYKVVGPEYKAYKTITKSSPLGKNETTACYEKDMVLYLNRTENAFIGIYKNPMKDLYPIESKIDVYYCPDKPKLAYVLRYCNKKWAFYLTFVAALLVLINDLFILFAL